MKKHNKFLSAVLGLTVATVMCVPAFAGSATLKLPVNQVWVEAGSETRSKNYSYANVTCDAVYPNSGMDTFSTVQVRLTDGNGTTVSKNSYTRVYEGSPAPTIVHIKQGYLSLGELTFEFRGNSSHAATAVVGYDAK